MNSQELEAYACLGRHGYLIDPKYAHDPSKETEALKQKCRACWSLRQHFPKWVSGYIESWAKDKARLASESADVEPMAGHGISRVGPLE